VSGLATPQVPDQANKGSIRPDAEARVRLGRPGQISARLSQHPGQLIGQGCGLWPGSGQARAQAGPGQGQARPPPQAGSGPANRPAGSYLEAGPGQGCRLTGSGQGQGQPPGARLTPSRTQRPYIRLEWLGSGRARPGPGQAKVPDQYHGQRPYRPGGGAGPGLWARLGQVRQAGQPPRQSTATDPAAHTPGVRARWLWPGPGQARVRPGQGSGSGQSTRRLRPGFTNGPGPAGQECGQGRPG
jgi:hypothetical protein